MIVRAAEPTHARNMGSSPAKNKRIFQQETHMKKCRRCGNKVNNNVDICPYCFGYTLDFINDAEETERCVRCGTQKAAGYAICSKCGCGDFYKTSVHAHVASYIEANTQFQKYHNSRAGHGFAAEDANALNDALHGGHVEKTGLSNAKNGADRIVDGVPIQTKYYNTASKTVNSAFDSSGYRYGGQRLEVPADQYEECVTIMKEKIKAGTVYDSNGDLITDPNKAEKIIQKGSVTYEQAKNIAKAGNIDSLVFDVKNNIISSSWVGGISFLISFARYKWNGRDTEDAVKAALGDALRSGGIAMLVGIASSQVLRTRSAAAMTVLVRCGIKPLYKTAIGKPAIEALARASLGKGIYGAAAVNHVSKLLRSNVVTSCVTTTLITLPDIYRASISKNISWAQFGQNFGVNVAGVAGGVGGWAAGAAAGAAIGSIVPILGTAIGGIAGGILGAFGGGTCASAATKGILDQFIKDDAKEMFELMPPIVEELCMEYLLSEEEANSFIEYIKRTVDASWLRDMYGAGETMHRRKMFARKRFVEFCDALIRRRSKVAAPSIQLFDKVANNFLEDIAQAV